MFSVLSGNDLNESTDFFALSLDLDLDVNVLCIARSNQLFHEEDKRTKTDCFLTHFSPLSISAHIGAYNQ